MFDLRSDTVTQPTNAMRQAMFEAPVGDDVYGDDLTTIALEAYAAEIFGKEAALFVPSGTFGNQLALLTHTKRGDEVILGEDAHIMVHEVGAAAVIAGVQLRTISSDNGAMSPEAVKKAIRQVDIHYPDTGLICIENAHGCGTVISIENMAKIHGIGKENSIPVHLDGARIFNAATHLGVSAFEIAKHCDTLNVCLSKGLCAPVGSILLGSAQFIQKARKNRKLMGGGMRQTGILAAAGLIALKEMPAFLERDHHLAGLLADVLSKFEDIHVKWSQRDINMVFFSLSETVIKEAVFVEGLKEQGILVNGMEDGLYRFVTHHWITVESIQKLELALKLLLS